MDIRSNQFEPERDEFDDDEAVADQDAAAVLADVAELSTELVPQLDLALSRREATARSCGYTGVFPPERPRFDDAEDVKRVSAEILAGVHRAGFIAGVGRNLIAFFEELEPETFAQFARMVLDIAENPKSSHRTRLRAIQAAFRPLRKAIKMLPKLRGAGDSPLRAHLELLLASFCSELTPERFRRLAQVFKLLGGSAARTPSDRVRTAQAALDLVYEALEMLDELEPLRKEFERRLAHWNETYSAQARVRRAEIRREMAEMLSRSEIRSPGRRGT